MVANGLCNHGHGRRRRRGGFGEIGRSRREVSIARVALLAGNAAGTLVSLAVAVTRLENAVLDLAVRFRNLRPRGSPARQIPVYTREALQLERLFLPLATGGPRAIQGTKTGVNGTSVGLRSEPVVCR